ncbi:PREDICTED: mesothelin, partial [Merops nubicus]|uniref:mesothelin n=1 Tax=Merops nubicus TaxID=57421 RepID=UPI0004F05FA9
MLLLETCSSSVMNQRDPVNLQMISNLTLLWQTAVYYTSLLTSAPAFPLASLPDRFLCYLSPSAVSNLSRDDALSLAQRISKNCPLNLTRGGTARERAPSSLTTEELQVASSLVRKFEHFPPAVLRALGQAAVGLSVSDIENSISEEDLAASLPVLGEVHGWNVEQSSAIINKLLSSGYQIPDGQSLARLGSLVAGLNTSRLQSLSPEVILEAIKLPKFVQQMVNLPSALKRTFVEKISSSIGHPADLVKYIPDALASYVPKSLLVFGEEKPNIQDLNSKTWTREQAAMFFSDVIKTEPDFSRLSQSVLQGFTCAAANEMAAERFQELAKVMKKKNVKLGEDQLSCLVKLVTLHGVPKDLDSYPTDLLLFLRPPERWSAFTLNELSGLIPVLDHSILQKIPKDALTLWLKDFARDSPLSRDELATVAKELLPRRQKRATDCPPDQKITEAVLNNNLMPIFYPPDLLRACLKNVSLENHLSQVVTYAFSVEQLAVLKDYLDETYPDGYPESLLPSLGPLTALFTPEDISKWKITSADTLARLLGNNPPYAQASAIIRRYIGLGNPLNTTALNAIGPSYMCLLNETELNRIDPSSLKLASLNISNCSQTTKNILYAKAKQAFSSQPFPAYYELIAPYLEGAPGQDLKALSEHKVNMNISTFVKLRKDALMSLTPSEVQGLLGVYLPDLKQWQNKPPIWEWVQRQQQSELDKLHIGLTGGTQEGYINIVTPKFQ